MSNSIHKMAAQHCENQFRLWYEEQRKTGIYSESDLMVRLYQAYAAGFTEGFRVMVELAKREEEAQP